MHDKVNILMVDDHPGKLLSYEVMLAELDENLIKATSGREALEELLKNDVAVVLMDVSMPEMDGFELAHMIRQHPRFQKTAIIFISAVHLTDLDRLKGYQLGAVDYISVPVIPELLRAKVTVFAELHRKTRQLQTLNHELEQRVVERTEEVERRAKALQAANEQLGRKHQELDAIVKTAPTIIFSTKADGSSDYISEQFQQYAGISPESFNGLGLFHRVHEEDLPESRSTWERCLEQGGSYEAEYRLRGKDGDYRWFRVRAVPIRDNHGQIIRWYGTCSDIHDSKLLEQSIRESAVKLEQMVDKRTVELRQLSGRLLTMQDEERRRMAREIHDGLGQELVAAKMMVDSILAKKPAESTTMAEVSKLIERALQQVRTISHLLHPPLLDEVGLLSALRWYLDGLSSRSGIKTSLNVHPKEFPRLASELETAIFRIVQEALTNVFRHSGAQKGWVTLNSDDQSLVVTVRDDGKGIAEPVAQLRPDSIGVGIGGMKQRVRELGGELRVSNANPGTLVEVEIPAVSADPREVEAQRSTRA
jgi:PAS domain S-box-containing protein